MKKNKGITLVSLVITIIVMAILGTAMVFYSKDQTNIKKINELYSDIQVLNTKVDQYYLKYGELPLICEFENGQGLTSFENYIRVTAQNGGADLSSFNIKLNSKDTDGEYWVIDVEKLDGVTLNYGYDEDYMYVKNNGKTTVEDNNGNIDTTITKNNLYVINTMSHQIYYPHGVFDNGIMYYAYEIDK